MRTAAALALIAASLPLAAADRRNTHTPNTDTPATFTAPAALDAWQARRAALRTQILSASGLLPMPAKGPLNPLVTGRIERDGYTIEKVALETLPGYWLGGNLYRPKAAGRHPAVLHPHGHWTYGRLENSENCSSPTLAINLARRGFVVFAYDMVGYNDTVQTPHDFSTPEHQLWGFTPLGLQLWNSIRVTDYLEGLPDVDAKKLAITGASGGGTQTFNLAAVDDRIAVAAPVNMVSGIMQGGCVCENAPGLRIGTNNIEIAALAAPRPLLAVAATGDWTKDVPRVEYPAMKKVWELYGKPELVEAVQFEAPHNYQKESREAVYEFLRKHLLPETPPFKERGASAERLQDMLVFHGRPLPAKARTFGQLFEEWKAASRAQTTALTAEQGRAALRAAFALESQTKPESVGIYFGGKGPAVLYLHPGGIEAARQTEGFKRLIAENRTVVLLEAFQIGAAKAPRDRSHRHFLCFNVSDDAARVADVAAVIETLSSKNPGPVEIQAEGKARWWALFGAALSGKPVRFDVREGEFAASDSELARDFFVPGLQRAGGAEMAQRILKGAAR